MAEKIKSWFINQKLTLGNGCVLLCCLIVICMHPFLLVYTKNVTTATFLDVILATFKMVSIALLFFMISLIFRLIVVKSAVFSMFSVLWFTNYINFESFIYSIIPTWKYWHIIPLYLILLLFVLTIIKYVGTNRAYFESAKILGAAFFALSVMNVVLAAPNIIEKIMYQPPKNNVENNTIYHETGEFTKDISNVYYIILDEYTRPDLQKEYFGIDASDFINTLKSLGFNYSASSKSSAPFTTYSVGNNLSYSIEFIDEITPAYEFHYIINNRDVPIFSLFKEKGFSIVATNYLPFVTNSSLVDKLIKLKELDQLSLYKTALDKSIFVRLQTPGYSEWKFYNAIFDNLERYIDIEGAEHRFAFVHLAQPHSPYIFDETGKLTPGYLQMDVSAYSGQLLYVTKRIQEILTSLVKNDPNCIIILQSDHGMREYARSYEEKLCVLNALYFRGEVLDIEGLGTVDTIRLTLNEMFNLKLEIGK